MLFEGGKPLTGFCISTRLLTLHCSRSLQS